MNEDKKTVCIRFDLDVNTNAELKYIAAKEGVTKPELITRILKEAVKK